MRNYNSSAEEQMYNCYKGQSHINQIQIVKGIPIIILKHFALAGSWNPPPSVQCNYYVDWVYKKIVKSTWNTFTLRKSAVFSCCMCHYYSTYNLFMLQEIFNWSVVLVLHMHNSEGLSSVLSMVVTLNHAFQHTAQLIYEHEVWTTVSENRILVSCRFCVLCYLWSFQCTAWQK
jgi:hypothetical protein